MGYFISKSKNANLASLNREGARAGQALAQGTVCKLNPSDGKLYACTSDGDVAIGVTGQAYSKDASVKLFHSGIIYIPTSQLSGAAGDTLFIGANGQLNTDGNITAGYIAETEDGYHNVNLSAFGTEAGEGGGGGGGGGNTLVPFRLYMAESQDVSLPESLFGHSLFIMNEQGSGIQSITMNAPSDTPELGTQIIVSLLIASGAPIEDGIPLQFNSPIIQLGVTSRVKTYDGVGRVWVLLTYDSISDPSDPEGGMMTGWFVDVLPYEDASVERIAYKATSSEWNAPLPTTLNQSINQLLLRLADAEDGLEGEKPKVSTLQGQMTTANTNIGTLQGQMATANTNIGTLQTNVGTNTTDISTEKPKVSTLQGQMTTANTNIGTLQGQMGTANTNIGTLQTNVGTLQTDVGSLQSSVSTIQSAIDDYNLGVMTYDNSDSGLTATTVKDAIDEIVVRLAALEEA